MPHALIIMGVSGCGKTTVGQALAEETGWTFLEGDTLHSAENIAKMRAGKPLDDADRRPWLDRIAEWITHRANDGQNCIVACSALRRVYRDRLRAAEPGMLFAYLKVPRETLLRRMQQREHFMPVSLLDSQLATLEPPATSERSLTVTATDGIRDTTAQILNWLDDRMHETNTS
ncbi:MAG: gluconokinase [Gammaproteobacteria bacterium]